MVMRLRSLFYLQWKSVLSRPEVGKHHTGGEIKRKGSCCSVCSSLSAEAGVLSLRNWAEQGKAHLPLRGEFYLLRNRGFPLVFKALTYLKIMVKKMKKQHWSRVNQGKNQVELDRATVEPVFQTSAKKLLFPKPAKPGPCSFESVLAQMFSIQLNEGPIPATVFSAKVVVFSLCLLLSHRCTDTF